MWWALVLILRETCVELLLALSYELLGSAGFFEGRVASFEVAGTLARLFVEEKSENIKANGDGGR